MSDNQVIKDTVGAMTDEELAAPDKTETKIVDPDLTAGQVLAIAIDLNDIEAMNGYAGIAAKHSVDVVRVRKIQKEIEKERRKRAPVVAE